MPREWPKKWQKDKKKKKKTKKKKSKKKQGKFILIIHFIYPSLFNPIYQKNYHLNTLYIFCLFCFVLLACGVPGPRIISKPQLQLKLQLQPQQILNPLCRARDRTCNPALPRHHQSHCTTAGAPQCKIFENFYYLFFCT